jgi:hypothetical protein
LSFLCIPLGRLIWDPSKANALDEFVDVTLSTLQTQTNPMDQKTRAAQMLAALPANLSADQIADHLRAIQTGVGAPALWHALQARGADATRQSPPENHLTALTVFATDPRMIKALGIDLPSRTLALLPDDPGLLTLFAERSTKLLAAEPDLWDHFPIRAAIESRLAPLRNSTPNRPGAPCWQFMTGIEPRRTGLPSRHLPPRALAPDQVLNYRMNSRAQCPPDKATDVRRP